MTERFALYYAPPVGSLLWQRAAGWLGRDPAVAAAAAPPAPPGLAAAYRHDITVSARRYGFHATLKAPMALPDGTAPAELDAALRHYATGKAPVAIGRLDLRFIDGFLALVPEEQTADLTTLVADIVTAFEPFRAPLPASERARRLQGGQLTARQIDLLDRFGYPYVLDEFRFHMTLTDRLPAGEQAPVLSAAAEWFAPILDGVHMLDRLALFHESQAGAPFMRLADFPLNGAEPSHD